MRVTSLGDVSNRRVRTVLSYLPDYECWSREETVSAQPRRKLNLLPLAISRMSQASTTNTTSWTVNKYSRCYANTTTVSAQDWQHYSTPTITLVLDQTTDAHGSCTSIRLRIIWRMDTRGLDPGATEQITFVRSHL